MSLRKEVFQTKVLQRLYPAAAPEAEPSLEPASAPKTAQLKPNKAPKTAQLKPNKAPGSAGDCGLPAKKIYTVLLPPEDYRPIGGDAQPEPISSADRTAVDLSGSDNGDAADGDPVRRRRKRRRRRKPDDAGAGRTGSPRGNAAQGSTEEPEERNGQALEVPEGQEQLSKSKKRKLKKKRQKEKLRSLGMGSKSRPLEFTYRRAEGGEEEEEEEENKEDLSLKVEEVLDFLRTTWDIYRSDRSSAAISPPLSPTVAESLFTRLSEGRTPPAAVSSLCRLRALLDRRDVEQLNTSLQEFRHTSRLNTDESLLICTLFQYWIDEVLPMQMEKT